MADVFSHEKRSEIMRSVKSSDNKSTEKKLIQIFHKYDIVGWRRHYKVKGHPDFIFPIQRIAIFVDGCFWHGHDCRNTCPADNQEYWQKKRDRNIRHDKEVTSRFESRGWIVIRIWECELKKNAADILLNKLAILRDH